MLLLVVALRSPAIAVKAEVEDSRDTFEMSIKARGQGQLGMFERVFGAEAPPKHGQVIEHDPVRAIEQKVPLRD